MTFDKFIQTYNGKSIDYDGGYGVQCVDLIKLYLDKVFGLKIGAIGNAEAYWRRYHEISVLKNNFDRIENTPDFEPIEGDICCWDTSLSKNGHVSIANGISNLSNFQSYDQNWRNKRNAHCKS